MAFSAELIDAMKSAFPGSAGHFEEQQMWTGTVESMVEDDLDLRTSRLAHVFIAGGPARRLYSGSPEFGVSGGRVVVSGVAVLGNIAVRSISPAASSAAAGSGTLGAQNILTILVNLPGYTLPPNVTADFMKGVLWGNASRGSQSTPDWNVDDFLQQNSDGQAFAPVSGGRIAGPYLLSSNFNSDSTGASFCDYLDMKQAAIDAAGAAVNFPAFNRVVIVMPNNGACNWAGVSSIGYWSGSSVDGAFTASFHWLRADTIPTRATGVQLASHELGHGFGLNHARSRQYPGATPQPLGAIGAAGVLTEYGDPFATMAAWSFGFYSAQHAQEILGWLSPSNYTVVQTSGQHSVNSYETRAAAGLVKALKVLRDAASDSWLWIEYHTNTGIYDSQVPSPVWSGALIHYEDASTGTYTNLLDFTPSTSLSDAVLGVGQTWTDPYSNLSITIGGISAAGSGSILSVGVRYGIAGCIPANPTVSLVPANPTVRLGDSTNLTVTVKSNNAAACPASTYSLSSVQAPGLAGVLPVTSMTLAGGASGSVTLTVTAGAEIGTFPLSVTASDAGTSSASGSGTVNVNVASLCVSANPSVTLSPPAVTLAAGSSTTFSLTLKNNNSSGCAASGWELTSIQPPGFTGTFSTRSLAGLASGASASVTLTEKAGTVSGTFTLSVTGTSMTAPATAGTGTANLTVTEGCTVAPVVSIGPTEISTKAGISTSRTISVQNGNAAGCAAATFALAATQPPGFTANFPCRH